MSKFITIYKVPKELETHGLSHKQLMFEDEAISRIIRDYTREAG